VGFRGEVDILFPPHVICFLVEIDVAPRRKRYFLITATGAKKKFVTNALFVIHRSKELRQFAIRVGNCDFFLYYRHLVAWYSRGDAIFLQEEKDDVQARVDSLPSVAFPLHGFLICPEDVFGNLVQVSNLLANNFLELGESSFVLINSLLGLSAFLFEVDVNGSR